MPCAEGVEVAFLIRADEEFQGTPVVFLTSLVTEQEAAGDGTAAEDSILSPSPCDWRD